MTSTQYKVDIQRALDECTTYLTNEFRLKEDGKDAWIFDIDNTLLSTIPYYKTHSFGGKKLNKTSLDARMKESKAPVVKPAMCLYNEIKRRGLKIFLISSRGEHLRDSTIDNLVNVGYYG
ncbi:hypothetical protein GIB67_041743 [Kingdonia uniflora]|uniref:Acid phosphatase n=1 Tax=Kingdonia uniflora TaxID=39325 RepID=A0A7J7NNV5_9MAGN|nr:hypothetical protein GIB67_041743 [Kingdonia uniflora]